VGVVFAKLHVNVVLTGPNNQESVRPVVWKACDSSGDRGIGSSVVKVRVAAGVHIGHNVEPVELKVVTKVRH